MESSLESAILCHGFESGVLAGKLCVRDAQMPNTVYVPTPPYVMSLSQVSWLVSCASRTHTSSPLSMFPRHIAWEYRHPWALVRPGRTTCPPRRLHTIHDTLCHSPLTVDNNNDSQSCCLVHAYHVLQSFSCHASHATQTSCVMHSSQPSWLQSITQLPFSSASRTTATVVHLLTFLLPAVFVSDHCNCSLHFLLPIV